MTLPQLLAIVAIIAVNFGAAVAVPHLAHKGHHRTAVAVVILLVVIVPAAICLVVGGGA